MHLTIYKPVTFDGHVFLQPVERQPLGEAIPITEDTQEKRN